MKRELLLPVAPESAELARSLVREAATEHGLDGDATWDLMLATSEAVSNAVMHGAACTDSAPGIRLCLEPRDSDLCVEVCDCGAFDDESRAATRNDTGGRGIRIIAAVADHFELVSAPSRTRVRFSKRRAATTT